MSRFPLPAVPRILAFLALAGISGPALAATFTVTNTNDAGAGSLLVAITCGDIDVSGSGATIKGLAIGWRPLS